MENLDPPPSLPPNQRWENGAFLPSRGFMLDLGGWEFAVPFYFVQDCRCPRHIQSVINLILDILIDIYVMINVT